LLFHRTSNLLVGVKVIKIQDIQLEKLQSLQGETGKHYLNSERVLILNTCAIGALRKELIHTLGMEQAKGFFIRYGYACGYHDAESIKHDSSTGDKTESYRLDTLFHTFIGMAHVIPLDIRCNKNEYLWPSEGIWHNSYEAEHHIRHFGPATEPVCWALAGHASGFQSALSGEQVIYKEISCSARGDPHCRFIGKTLAEWGKEILPELRYYQETNPGPALEQFHTSIQEQNELLKKTIAIHGQLTKMVLNGEDMPAIACAAGRLIGGTVIVEDQFFRLSAYFSPVMTTKKDPPAFSARDIFNDWRYRHIAATLTQEKRSVLLPAEPAKNMVSRFISPIVIGREVLGYVNILKNSAGFTKFDQMILDCIVTVFALKMMQDRAVAEVETRYKDDFVDNLISGSFYSEASIIERACYLGYNLNQPHQVLVINFDTPPRSLTQPGRDERQYLHFKNQLVEVIKAAINSCNRHGMIAAKNDEIIIITALTGNDLHSSAADLAQDVQKRVNMQFSQVTISIGIGRICHTPKDFSQSYQEARRALKVIKGLNQSNAVISFDSLGTFGLLLNAANQQDLLAFMNEQIGKLLKYDTRHKSQLVETLHLYFIYDGNIKEAARAAAVTPSGFKYRLGKICEVGGFTLKDPNKRFDLQMALKIWYIIKECKHEKPADTGWKLSNYKKAVT